MKAPNPDFKTRIEEHLKGQHFMKLLGFEILSIEVGRVSGRLVLRKEHLQETGLVHGGVTATIADIVSGFAAYTMVPSTYKVVTAELRVSYLHPGKGRELKAIGWVMKSGNKINFCESEVWSVHDHRNVLIAKASAVMASIFPEDILSS